MTDHGDDGDDDPQLGGLRAIWLSMPDEDPPQGGLAELMAAARVKAEEMAQPSLLQRIVAMLRRPPVLALATVMVLIAGAVLVGNRREKMDEATPVADQQRAAEMKAEPTPATTPAPAQGQVPAEAPVVGADSPLLDTTTAHNPTPRPRVEREVTVDNKPSKRAPAKKGKNEKAGEEMFFEGGRGAIVTSSLAKSEDARHEAKKPAKPAAADDGELQIAEPEAPPAEETQVGGAPPPRTTATAAPESEALADSASSAGKAKQQQVGAAQLHAQARTAASRNDCAAVKVLAQRIAKQDPAYYRANVTKDAALGKCIGTPAP